MVRQDDVVGYCEPKPEAGDLVLDRWAAIKAFKQTALFLFRYSGALIGDFEIDGVVTIG